MKKIFAVIFMVFFFTSASPAHATVSPFQYRDLLDFYTVDSNSSTTAKNIYAPTDDQWLYVHLPDQWNGALDWKSTIATNWYLGSEADPRTGISTGALAGSGIHEFWLQGLPKGVTNAVGTWTVSGFYQYLDSSNFTHQAGFAQTNYTVTPEPASMALFGLGAGVLGLVRSRRNKRGVKVL